MTPRQCVEQQVIQHHVGGMAALTWKLSEDPETRAVGAAMRVHLERLQAACDRLVGSLAE